MLISTGGFILDQIHFLPPSHVVDPNTLYAGGAGVHGLYGMKMWSTAQQSLPISFIALIGLDCPSNIKEQYIDHLKVNSHYIQRPYAHPRAVNTIHSDTGVRDFAFTTSADEYALHFRLKPEVIPEYLLKESSQWHIHVIASHSRMMDWSREMQLRSSHADLKFFWEPSPGSCVAEEFDSFILAAKSALVVSPNHYELAQLVGKQRIQHHTSRFPQLDPFLGEMKLFLPKTKSLTEYEDVLRLAWLIKDAFLENKVHSHLIIRSGARGCLIMTDSLDSIFILPAFWDLVGDMEKVLDVTGAGNSFMGGLMAGFFLSNSILLAAMYASISASFTVQRLGLPSYSEKGHWNDPTDLQPYERLDQYKQLLLQQGLRID